MDFVTMLRDLWRHRRYVVGVFVLAVLAGLMVAYKFPGVQPRQYEVGVASAHILVDTPSSQVVQVSPPGSATLGAQANLVASLMVDGAIKDAIAQRAGLRPSELMGLTTSATVPGSVGSSASTAPPPRDAFAIITQVLNDSSGQALPIIEIQAQAPTDAKASGLVSATISGLKGYLTSAAATERIPEAHRLQVTGLGESQATTEVRGPSMGSAFAVILIVFGLGCAGILAVLALIRGWRAASLREQLGHEAPHGSDVRLPRDQPFRDSRHDGISSARSPEPDEPGLRRLPEQRLPEPLRPDEDPFDDRRSEAPVAAHSARPAWLSRLQRVTDTSYNSSVE